MSNVKVQSDPMPGRPVNVTIPVSLAANLEKMHGVTQTVLKRLGCGTCHSGFDLRFIHEDDFRFNEVGQLLER